MKPWSELGRAEKIEAIAKRLGWKWWQSKRGYFNITAPDGEETTTYGRHREDRYDRLTGKKLPESTVSEEFNFPDWINDDGVAFVEVFSKIVERRARVQLRYTSGIHGELKCVDVDWSTTFVCVEGSTWADVICHAAYRILPEPEGK